MASQITNFNDYLRQWVMVNPEKILEVIRGLADETETINNGLSLRAIFMLSCGLQYIFRNFIQDVFVIDPSTKTSSEIHFITACKSLYDTALQRNVPGYLFFTIAHVQSAHAESIVLVPRTINGIQKLQFIWIDTSGFVSTKSKHRKFIDNDDTFIRNFSHRYREVLQKWITKEIKSKSARSKHLAPTLFICSESWQATGTCMSYSFFMSYLFIFRLEKRRQILQWCKVLKNADKVVMEKQLVKFMKMCASTWMEEFGGYSVEQLVNIFFGQEKIPDGKHFDFLEAEDMFRIYFGQILDETINLLKPLRKIAQYSSQPSSNAIIEANEFSGPYSNALQIINPTLKRHDALSVTNPTLKQTKSTHTDEYHHFEVSGSYRSIMTNVRIYQRVYFLGMVPPLLDISYILQSTENPDAYSAHLYTAFSEPLAINLFGNTTPKLFGVVDSLDYLITNLTDMLEILDQLFDYLDRDDIDNSDIMFELDPSLLFFYIRENTWRFQVIASQGKKLNIWMSDARETITHTKFFWETMQLQFGHLLPYWNYKWLNQHYEYYKYYGMVDSTPPVLDHSGVDGYVSPKLSQNSDEAASIQRYQLRNKKVRKVSVHSSHVSTMSDTSKSGSDTSNPVYPF